MPVTIKLVRHGESVANIGTVRSAEAGDHSIALTEKGRSQARAAGSRLGSAFLGSALIYTSPFLRARETLRGILDGCGVSSEALRVREDPRLREVEHGYGDVESQRPLQTTHGPFFYRFYGGESPADCFDRTSGFLESMMRQVQRKCADKVIVITHGLTIRCFVMRFLHLTVEQFESMLNPANCDIVTLASRDQIERPVFASTRWGVEGIKVRDDGCQSPRHQSVAIDETPSSATWRSTALQAAFWSAVN